MSKVINLTDENFEKEVIKSNLPVLVDFWAPWCQPCLMLAPILDKLSEELDGRLKICKVNIEIDNNRGLASRYNIQSIPSMKLFKNGKIVREFMGIKQKVVLKQELEKEL